MASENHNVDLLARDLVRLLADLTGLHAEMAAHMRDKLDAMRGVDTDRIQSISARELLLLEKMTERDGLRRQIIRRLLEGLGVQRRLAAEPSAPPQRGAAPAFQGGGRAEPIRLSELADLLAEPRRSQLLTAATGLRVAVLELQRLQQTSTLVTHEMIKHLRYVLEVMCGGGPDSESYSRGGRRQAGASASVFEAVG